MTPGQACATCNAFAANEKQCRAKAPQITVQMDAYRIKVHGVWPATDPENWCREWERKVEDTTR